MFSPVLADTHAMEGGAELHAVFVTEPAGGGGWPQAVHSESALEQVAVHVPLRPFMVLPVPMIHPLPGQLWHPEQLAPIVP